ncbi:peptidoglycan-binding protein [Streptomyces sp. NRRL S-474]|uniref:peptidoglycan-binding protein n=1 Tax=Streptomyces sp. NRRL S-474 TaxID=1463909 RepID=UPI00056D11A3|nr:peptidoglycan-binding protein [Streptomyces sp. NRRL S-474]
MAQERSAGVELARLLRRWWEESGSASGGTRPTQQALAARLGVDQTTLSRYLNPKHLSTAPPRVVDALHTQLRAPAAELEQARALCRAALRENGRQRAADGEGEHAAPAGAVDGSGERPAPDASPGEEGADATTGPAAARGAGDRGTTGRPRPPWLRPALVAAAVVLAFTAGMVVHDRLSGQDSRAMAGGAAGAASPRETPLAWPLLYMGQEDQFSRARALQHLLNAHGYTVRADGFLGADTRDAVMDFQRRKHLPADGKVGRFTWPELVKEVGPGSGPDEVRAAQELLNNVGQGGTPVSGSFTAATAEDVRYFQRTHDLPETGRVDVDTWLALLVEQLPPVKAPAYQRATSPLPSASE